MKLELFLLMSSPFIGSFLGAVIERLPHGRDIISGRSTCDHCHKPLSWYEVIPILSFLIQKRRCKQCAAQLSSFYPIIEIATILVTAICVLLVDNDIALIASVFLGWLLLVLAWIDWRHFILPNILTLPLIPVGLAVIWLLSPDDMLNHAVAAIVGYATLWLVAATYKAARGRDGIGMGDAKLFAAAGAWVGLSGLISVLLVACLSALSYALIMRLSGHQLKHDTPLSFGSFLCLGLFLTWLSGDFLFGSLMLL